MEQQQKITSLKKIVIIGPESTGKSFLSSYLAEHYKTLWVKEYAREYLLTHGTAYSFDDLLVIAKKQLELEEEGITEIQKKSFPEQQESINQETKVSRPYPLFIDTNMVVMKVWCEFVFNRCHQWILDKVVERKYDLYLLCNIDIPWVKDELREYPDQETREKLYHHYKDIMINQSVPWVDITGDYEERLLKALSAVDKLCNF